MGKRQWTLRCARRPVRALLAIMLAMPMLALPVTPVQAQTPYSDTPWTGMERYDIVIGGVTREKIVQNMNIYRPRGFNENFAWYSDEKLIQSGGWDNRAWAIKSKYNEASYQYPVGGQWWAPLKSMFYLAPSTFTAFTHNGHFIAKCNGAFSRPASPLPLTVTNPAPPTIAGYAWSDTDGDGQRETGEPPHSGLVVRFAGPNGVTGEATTDANGHYRFAVDATAGRIPGQWTVTPDASAQWSPTGAASYTATIVAGAASAGREYAGHDFGTSHLGTITGVLWNDLDGSGSRQIAEEPGLAGWTVRLLKDGAVYAVAGTDADGTYCFTGLPTGSYRIEQVVEGWTRTCPAEGSYAVDLAAGGVLKSRDFGYRQTGSITPLKVHDLDMNGLWDEAAEPLVGGWLMSLFGTSLTPVTTTDSLLTAPSWDGLAAGTYTVRQEPRMGWASTGPDAYTIALGPGQQVRVPFFDVELGRIEGCAYHDLDADGSIDTAEEPRAGVEVALWKDGVFQGTNLTRDDGTWCFTDLRPGAYTVMEKPTSSYWHATTSETREVVLSAGQQVTLEFGSREVGDLEGIAYEDRDGDGTLGAGDIPAAGVMVSLVDSSGVVVGSPVTTGLDGRYFFEAVPPGSYTAERVVADGSLATNDTSQPVEVVGGRLNQGPTFLSCVGVTVAGLAFHDTDANGILGSDEPGIPGWAVALERMTAEGWSPVSTSVTDPSGAYAFSMLLPGDYRVTHAVPAHWKQTAAPRETGFMTSGSASAANDFGAVQLGRVILYKWDDSDSDGVWDGGEAPLGDWAFDVSGTGVDGSTLSYGGVKTGPDGALLIEDVMPGEYAATSAQVGRSLAPDGTCVETGWRSTTADEVPISLAAGETDGASFGAIHLGYIAGRITHELYDNGVPGVKVVLEETGATTFTDSAGRYFFYDIEPNGTAACPTLDYLVGMDLTGSGYSTTGAVDKPVVMTDGATITTDFAIHEDTYGTAPRPVAFWKNWKSRYTREQMEVLVARVRAGSSEFSTLTVDAVSGIVSVDTKTPPRTKARAQYLTFWLNTASGNLGLSTVVDVSGVTGWQTVLSRATPEGLIAVIDLIYDAEEQFVKELLPAAWDTIKNIFDQLNAGALT